MENQIWGARAMSKLYLLLERIRKPEVTDNKVRRLFLNILDPVTGATSWREAIAGEDMKNPNILAAVVRTAPAKFGEAEEK